MKLKHKLRLYRRYFKWKKHQSIFIHIPKAAGTSINHAIYGKTLGHYEAHYLRSTFPELYQRSFVFSFVRNPWDRVLSAYLFAKKGQTSHMGVKKPEQYNISAFKSFESFLFDWLAEKDDLSELDFIFQSQYPFLMDASGKNIVDFTGKVENLTDDIKHVESALGRKINLSRLNSTTHRKDYKESFTNDKMIELVRDKYAKDISMFNYSFSE